MYRRRFLPLLGGLLGASAGCRPHVEPRKLRVALIPRYMQGPLYLADELGYFREAGLQLDIKRMPESAQSMPLLAGGQLDVCFLGISPAFINAVLRGGHLRVVAAREVVTPNCGVPGRVYGSRVAFPNGFGDLHQLKGKRVAVTGRTTHIAFMLDVLLESAGMTTNDVTVVYLRRNEALAALVGGKIDAMAFGELDAEPESASVKLVPGPSVEELLRGLQTTFVMFGRDLMDADAETGTGFLWAYLRGVEQFRAGKTTRALDELALAENIDPQKAGSICRDRISANGLVAPASVQRFVDWSVKKGFVEQSMDASRLIETRFVEAALRRLGRGQGEIRMKNLAWGLWLPACGLILWQALATAGVLSPLFFPPPEMVLAAAGKMLRSGELARHAAATGTRMAVGFLLGALVGLPLGLLMGSVSRARKSLEPTISALYSTPKLSLLPMLMLFLGVNDMARIALIALGCLIIVTIHALDAVRNINAAYVELAANYGARGASLFRTVYLPACLPQVFTGLRLASGRALVTAVSVELVSSPDGFGSLIWMAWQTFATDRLFVAILITAALGGSVHQLMRWLERKVVPWKVRHAD